MRDFVLEKMLDKLGMPQEIRRIFKSGKKYVIPNSREELMELAMGGKTDVYNVEFDVPGKRRACGHGRAPFSDRERRAQRHHFSVRREPGGQADHYKAWAPGRLGVHRELARGEHRLADCCFSAAGAFIIFCTIKKAPLP